MNNEWQPIETVPADKEVILYHPNWGYRDWNNSYGRLGFYSSVYEDFRFSDFYILPGPPTHWMPLPSEPPKEIEIPWQEGIDYINVEYINYIRGFYSWYPLHFNNFES